MKQQKTLQEMLKELISYQYCIKEVKEGKVKRGKRFRFITLMKLLVDTRFYEETPQQQKIFIEDLLNTGSAYLRSGQEVCILQTIN